MGKADELKSNIGSGLKESASSSAGSGAGFSHLGKEKGGRERDRRSFLIDTKLIKANAQVRENFGDHDIERLAESMRTHGQLQAVVVCRDGEGVYQLVAGERRLRAARLAGLKQLRCELYEGELREEQILELQLIENLQRIDLNPVEEARGYRSLIKLYGWSISKVAQRLGKNKSTVSRSLALLKLPDDLIEKVRIGEIPRRVARELGKLDDTNVQEELGERYISEELNTEDVVAAVSKEKGRRRLKARPSDRRAKEGEEDQNGSQHFVREFQTKHAKIRMEYDDPRPSNGDLQAELLAVVKQIGKEAKK